jgi:hypothetical protein
VLPGLDYMELSHSAEGTAGRSGRGAWFCGAFVVGADCYCARTASLQAFCEANRCAPAPLRPAFGCFPFSMQRTIGAQ